LAHPRLAVLITAADHRDASWFIRTGILDGGAGMWEDLSLWAVVAESDCGQWDWESLERVGPLRFSMDLPEAIAAMDAQEFTSDTAHLFS
jgi:hypothetical protein